MSQKNRGKKGGQTRTTTKKSTVDKTFGMKNKKGKAAQKVVKSQQGNQGNRPTKKKTDGDEDLADFVRSGYTKANPKTQNNNNNQTREEQKKAEKANPFIDLRRDVEEPTENNEQGGDSMSTWNADKLNEVVNKKMSNKPTSDKICQYFLKAIEEEKYGYFWECPNGDECIYRHALPPDYVFKSKEEKKIQNTKSLEEIIEERRAGLVSGQGTPVNEKTFKEWKDKKLQDKRDKEAEAINKRKKDIKEGNVKLNGREILTQQMEKNKFMFDEEGAEETIDLSAFMKEKIDQEEQLDKENYNLISKVQSEFSDYKEPTEDELKKIIEGNNTNENNNVITTDGIKIDASLYQDEDVDDIDEDV